MKLLTTIQRGAHAFGFKVAKNSPAIFAVAGVVGFGVTAVLAYKARPKIEKVVEDIEAARAANVPIDNTEVGMRIMKAVAAPITVGILSTVSVIMSYKILTNRLSGLASLLAATQLSKAALEDKIKEKYGKEAYSELISVNEDVTYAIDENGDEVASIEQTLSDIDGAIGFWYKNSKHYHPDNHDYNMAWIDELIGRCEKKLFTKTRLTVNDINSIFKVDTIRNGALLGWGSYTYFNVEKIVVNEVDKVTNQIVPQILIKWSTPEYIWQADTDPSEELE